MTVEDRVIAQRNQKRHDELCKLIGDAVNQFMQIGPALIELQELQIYKATHKTFEKFVNETFGIERRRAYQIIKAAKVAENLCKRLHKKDVPKIESHLRAIGKVDEEKQASVVEIAHQNAASENRKPVEKDFLDAVIIEEGSHEPAEPEPEPEPKKLSIAEQAVQNAPIAQAIVKAINEALRLLRAVEEVPGTELLVAREKSIEMDLKSVKGSVLVTIPHSVCPRCKGKGCPQCGNHGWVNSVQAKELGDGK